MIHLPLTPVRKWVLLTVVALVPIVLLALSSIVLATRQVNNVVDDRVRTTAAVSSVVIGQRTADLVTLVHSYATRPSLVRELARRPIAHDRVQLNLAGLVHAVPGISSAFVTDINGTSLTTYPFQPSLVGADLADQSWFTGLLESGRAYVSGASLTEAETGTPAINVTDYVRGSNGEPIAVLGVAYNLNSISAFTAEVGTAQGITLRVTDAVGNSLTTTSPHGLISLANDPRVAAAQQGLSGLLDYAPVLPGGARGPEELSAYTPVRGTGWTVIASIPSSVAFAGIARLQVTVLVIAAVLVLLLLWGVRLIARSDRRGRDAAQALQRRDRELARVLESGDEGFLSVDGDGLITAWNARAEEMHGWSASEVLGRNMLELLLPTPLQGEYLKQIAQYQSGADTDTIGRRVEMTVLHRDGHQIPVEVGLWAHEDGLGFSAFSHDITERLAMQAELLVARDEAMQASRLKSEFLANMSHEIRTPMNGVIGMTGLLLETELNVTQRDYAETVCSSAEALLTVIDDILDFSKIEAGKLDVERVPFDLRSVVEESAVLLSARAQQNGLELTCWVDPDLPAALVGDPGRLRQVLLNLLGNAVKFTPEGEVNLSVRLAQEEPPGTANIELEVRDTGIGMSEASLELLFDAFTQADTSTSRRYGGTGLGLAISKQLVELMGGALTVTSELGVGSTFTAMIPLAIGVAATRPADDLAELDGVRALIVDDNATNQRVLSDMVTAWGCVAAVADGAEQALAMLRRGGHDNQPFDVMLLDLNMPHIDGYALARMVQADAGLAGISMIMLTSSAQRGEAERSLQAGIAAYLTKPVRAAQLRNALGKELGARAPVHEPTSDPGPSWGRSAESDPVATDVVLVVEDNVVNQKVLTAMLTRIGYRSDVASNGFEALAALDRNTYTAVFMDCQMPLMDGYEATQKLRQREGADRHTHVIAVTASAMATDRERCMDAGMDDYLTKPFKAKELTVKLADLVRRNAERVRTSGR